MPHPKNNPRRSDPNFLVRDTDGSVRLRMRFKGPLASMMEEAAGTTPVVDWIEATLEKAAREQLREIRAARRGKLRPPEE